MQRIELRIGEDNEYASVDFTGEQLDRIIHAEGTTTLYETLYGRYVVHEEIKTHYYYFGSFLSPEPEYDPSEQRFELDGTYKAEEIAEDFPEFAETVGVTLVSEEG